MKWEISEDVNIELKDSFRAYHYTQSDVLAHSFTRINQDIFLVRWRDRSIEYPVIMVQEDIDNGNWIIVE